jgi:hypothetical protein
VTPALQLRDDLELVLREENGMDLVDTRGRGDRLGDLPGVTGEHDDPLHPGRVQPRHHVGGVGPQLVRDGDHPDGGVVDGDDHGRSARRGECVGGSWSVSQEVLGRVSSEVERIPSAQESECIRRSIPSSCSRERPAK